MSDDFLPLGLYVIDPDTGEPIRPATREQQAAALAAVGDPVEHPAQYSLLGRIASLITVASTSLQTLANIFTRMGDGSQVVTGPLTDTQLRASNIGVQDEFTADEPLPDQPGADDVLTFTFAADVSLIWVRSIGGVSRASVSATPTPVLGTYCADGEPVPITVRASSIKVYAPTGVTVSVVGYRYA